MRIKTKFDFLNEKTQTEVSSYVLADEEERLLISLGFDKETKKNLLGIRFGYECYVNNVIMAKNQWPKERKFISAQSDFIVTDVVDVYPNDEVMVKSWSKKDEKILEDITEFKVGGQLVTLTKLQFINKFTLEEQSKFEKILVKCRNGTSELDENLQSMILVIGRHFESATNIRLDNPDTISFIDTLISCNVLTEERKREILNTQ